MYEAHPDEQRNDAQGHDFVLPKQAIIPDISARKSEQYYNESKSSTPPTKQQRRIILHARARFGRRIAVESSKQYHCHEQLSRRATSSAEGRAGCRVLSRVVRSCSIRDRKRADDAEDLEGALIISSRARQGPARSMACGGDEIRAAGRVWR